jgi:polar amino acid transport system substrate-binding protein
VNLNPFGADLNINAKKTLIVLLLSLFVSSWVQANDKVTLQLKWLHQFQFAGYYAALEKGYFAEEGLDVTLYERDPNKNNILQVIDGEADYGVADSAILLYQTNTMGVKIVAPIFQHSPNVLITLKSSGIKSPLDLVGKRVRFYNNEAEGFSIMAMLAEYNVMEQGIIRQPFTQDYNVLLTGETDAIYGYSTNEPFWLRQQGADVHIINPVNFGIDLYGDMLFTSEKEANDKPQRVEAMRRAVLKGWEYALDNKEEIARLILDKYSQRKSFEALMYEARGLELAIERFTTPLGTMDEGRLKHIVRLFAKHGLLDRDFSVEGYIFDRPGRGRELDLTREEQAFIANHRKIRVGIDRSWYPFDFVDEKGRHSGIAADYLHLLSKNLGLSFDVETRGSWDQVLQWMRNRELDMLAMAASTPERSEYTSFTRPYIKSPMVIVTDNEVDYMSGAEDLRGKQIAVVKDYASHEWLKTNHPELSLVLVGSTVEGLNLVSNGHLDAFVDNLASVSFFIKQQGLANLKVSGQFPYSFDLAMGARSDWPLLRGILQKGLDSITPQQHAEIYDKWVRLEFETHVDYSKVAPAFLVLLSLIIIGGIYTWRLRVLHGRLQQTNDQLHLAEQRLIEKNQQLEHLSITDKLTDVYNRHKLDRALKDLVAIGHRYARPVSVMLFDLDFFKDVNDHYGHQVGDKVLKTFAGLVIQHIRRTDVFGRWGGEEFLLICPETDLHHAAELAEKVRKLIEDYQFEEGFIQTVSCGVSQLKPAQTVDQLVSYTDKLLYQAKQQGRNKIVHD